MWVFAYVLAALTVIKRFVVIQNIASGFVSRYVDLLLHSLMFQQMAKTFCNCVLVTVTAREHIASQSELFQKRQPPMSSLLTTIMINKCYTQVQLVLWMKRAR